MKATHGIALSVLGLMLSSRPALAGVTDQLSTAELLQIEAGVPITKTQDMAASSWPAVSVFQLVDATPEEAMADFTDFNRQASYLGSCCGVLTSSVLDSAVGGDPRVQRVLYEIEVPIFANERYELREELSKGDDGSYRVVWGKVSSGGHSDSIFGRAVFEPYGSKTLFNYYNYAQVTTTGAGLFSGKSVSRTQKTVAAMARHMELESAGKGPRLEENLTRLRGILGK